jgi:hypothetical protein
MLILLIIYESSAERSYVSPMPAGYDRRLGCAKSPAAIEAHDERRTGERK